MLRLFGCLLFLTLLTLMGDARPAFAEAPQDSQHELALDVAPPAFSADMERRDPLGPQALGLPATQFQVAKASVTLTRLPAPARQGEPSQIPGFIGRARAPPVA